MKKVIKGEFEFEVVKKKKGFICLRMDCKGMMSKIEGSIKDEDAKLKLEEYAKFWLADKLGIKQLPLNK